MTNEERQKIDQDARDNAARYWQHNTNPFDSRDVRYLRYNEAYKAAGGKS